jgi:hypothetical protein
MDSSDIGAINQPCVAISTISPTSRREAIITHRPGCGLFQKKSRVRME